MRLALKGMLPLATTLLLTGCGTVESGSYMIDGARHSLALTRTKTFFWSSDWELELVTARNPECMRRHKLQSVPPGGFKVELFRSLEGNYIVKQGSNWYVTETQKCRLQKYPAPPREPGDLLGSFEEREGEMKFIAAPPAPPVVPPTPPLQPLPAPDSPGTSTAPPASR